MCEFHHEPTTLNLGIASTVLLDHGLPGAKFGEVSDLQWEPLETRELRDDPNQRHLKYHLRGQYIGAELGKEPIWTQRHSSRA
jgi:hypothetical protein